LRISGLRRACSSAVDILSNVSPGVCWVRLQRTSREPVFQYRRVGPAKRASDGIALLASRKRIADAGDHGIPTRFFIRGVVDQYAGDELPSKIAAVVPDKPVAEAGDHKKVGCDPSIDDGGGRMFPGQEGGGRIVGIVANRLNGEICSAIRSEEPRSVAGFGFPRVIPKNVPWHIHRCAALSYHIALPFAGLASCQNRPQRKSGCGDGSAQCHQANPSSESRNCERRICRGSQS
jgi:hypothetical protein